MKNFILYGIAAVWLVNGLYCKVLNQVPRHQEIVARVLGETYAQLLTALIGFSEIVMAIWVLSGYQSKLCAAVQISVVLMMNVLEWYLVPDLLLWGRFNLLFSILFVLLVYFQAF